VNSEQWEELPDGWEWASISQVVAEIRNGTAKQNSDGRGYPVTRIETIQNSQFDLQRIAYVELNEQEVETFRYKEGDIIFSHINSEKHVGKTAIYKGMPSNLMHGMNLLRLRPNAEKINPSYFHFFLLSEECRQAVRDRVKHAVNQVSINQQNISTIQIPLAPLPEQQRLIEKIERLFAESRTAREALAQVPTLLKRFRQAVPAKAFRGELTERDPSDEPASVLLERIRTERRRKWEEVKRVGSKKYIEPEPPDTSGLPELPEEWCWIAWGQISNWITYGFTRPMPHVEHGIPIVTAKNIFWGKIDFKNTHKTPRVKFEELSDKDHPKKGDILLIKDGVTTGRAAIVETDDIFCINQSVGVIWLRSCPMDRKYLLYAIEAPFTQNIIQEQMRGVAMPHLSVTDFGRMSFPLAPLAEQSRIVAKIESLFALASSIERAVAVAQRRAEKVDQVALARAFRGEL